MSSAMNAAVPTGVSPDGPFVPFRTSQFVGRKVLVLAPHQDDEALGCGGAILLHAHHGDAVKVIFLTDGARGDVRGEHAAAEYVERREREARQAATILGVTDLEFWNAPDGELSTVDSLPNRLTQLLRDYRPTLVYAPSPIEFHPDHRATAALLWNALQQVPMAGEVAFFEINRPLQANALLDITGVADAKRRACDVYVSQLANYPYTDAMLGLNRYRALTVAATCDYAEGYFVMAASEIAGRAIETFAERQHVTPHRPPAAPPLVSIIVRTRNRVARLSEALASLHLQTQRDLEVIVVNDGGIDVRAVIAEWDGRLDIRYVWHDTPRGRAAAANTGLNVARGKYLGFLDDDDRLYPGHLEKLTAHLEATGDAAAYSDCERTRYAWNGRGFALAGPPQIYKGVDFDRERLQFGNYIPIMTMLMRRELLAGVGGFDESLECLEDWDYWLRLSTRTSFRRIPGVTAEYRMFDEPTHDWRRWQAAIYRKNVSFWTVENVASVWPRIEASFEAREAALLDTLAAERAARRDEVAALHAELQLVRGSLPQRLSRRVRRLLPERAVTFVRRVAASRRV
jgi:LmbE family N-acetylglucosaminyl deacetylase/glycosyltransferase involved in cell wall biosynthesis